MPIHMSINIIQHLHMLVQLISNLYTQIPLAAYAFAQPVQMLVLLPQHVLVVLVYLLVVKRALIRRRVRVVAVGEQCGSVGVFLGQCRRLRVVGESDGFGCIRRVAAIAL